MPYHRGGGLTFAPAEPAALVVLRALRWAAQAAITPREHPAALAALDLLAFLAPARAYSPAWLTLAAIRPRAGGRRSSPEPAVASWRLSDETGGAQRGRVEGDSVAAASGRAALDRTRAAHGGIVFIAPPDGVVVELDPACDVVLDAFVRDKARW